MWPTRTIVRMGLVWGSLLLGGCADYLTGQLAEPPGALQVTKLTLFDTTSRDHPVFTDTSIPNCAMAPDCTQAANRDLSICRVCFNDVAADKYGPLKSPPTPDSGDDIRVIFNKIPTKFSGADIAVDASLDQMIKLTCSAPCTGAPPMVRALNVIGSNLSFEPTFIPYGPSLQLQLDRSADARTLLEPDTSYQVQVSPLLAGRDGVTVQLDDSALKLLSFRTEPFQVLSTGKGDGSDATKNDTWVYADSSTGDGTSATPYTVQDLPETGVLALRMNAPVDVARLQAAVVDARIDGVAVSVTLGLNVKTQVFSGHCISDDQRTIFIAPTTLDKWPIGKRLSVTIPSGVIWDLNQADGAGFKTGTHSISSSITVITTLLGGPAGADFTGQTIAGARGAGHC